MLLAKFNENSNSSMPSKGHTKSRVKGKEQFVERFPMEQLVAMIIRRIKYSF